MESGITSYVWSLRELLAAQTRTYALKRGSALKIIRHGTNNPHRGTFEIHLANPTVRWDSRKKALEVSAHHVYDFGWGQNMHNYRVLISIPEFTAQLLAVRKAASADPQLFSSLRSIIPELLRLVLECTENGPAPE